jgi:hypothetical protein
MGRHTFLVASFVCLVALARASIDGTYALVSSRDAGAARLGHAQQAISSPRCRDAMPPVDGPLPKMCSGTVMRGGERSRARAPAQGTFLSETQAERLASSITGSF